MKVAVVRYKYVNYGGAEGFVDQYTNQLASAGHDVHIFAHQWGTTDHPHLNVHLVPAWTFNAWIRSLSFSWFALRKLRKGNFDIVQSHERIFFSGYLSGRRRLSPGMAGATEKIPFPRQKIFSHMESFSSFDPGDGKRVV